MSDRPRPETLPVSSPRVAPWQLGVGALLLVGILASPAWGPRLLRQFAYFHVRKIEVLGARYTPPAEIIDRMHVDTMRSIWDPLGPLAARVQSHPQVERVAVTRRLPGTLVVDLVERRPVALTQTPAGLRAVDERGILLPLDPSRTPVDAPVVRATARDTTVYHLLGRMQREAPRLYARLSSLGRVGSNEVILQLNGFPVRAMTSVTLARLSDIEPVERDLARRQLHAAELDLRYRDQVIARLP